MILRSYIVQARKSLVVIAGSVDWCYQNSRWTLLFPTLRPQCWYFLKTTWHQTRKRVSWSRSMSGNLLKGTDPCFIFVQHVERHISTFNITWCTVLEQQYCNICCSINIELCIIRFTVLQLIELLNGIFQHSTSHDALFNISWTAVLQLQHLLLNKYWTVYHSLYGITTNRATELFV